MKIHLYLLVFSCISLTFCKNGTITLDKHSVNSTCTKTFLQVDGGLTKLFQVEKYDTFGKRIEIVTYSYKNDLINSVVRIFYDSLNRISLIKTVFPNSQNPNSRMLFNSYDKNGLIIKRIFVDSFSDDSIFNYCEYDFNKRLKREKTITKGKTNRTTFREYIYDKDSLSKIFTYDFKRAKRQINDSIIYFKDGKIIYRRNPMGGFDSQTFFYKNNLIYREIDQFGEYIYIYDNQNKLIRKEDTRYNSGGMLDLSSPSTKYVFTYVYE